MGARRLGRERALQALYHLELSQAEPEDALAAAWAADPEAGKPDPESEKFALELVEGVRQHQAEIDALLEKHSHNWRLDRMTWIDRNVLRLGVFELKYREDIPKKVTLNEAVEIGRRFGTEQSSAFINGLLDRVATELAKP